MRNVLRALGLLVLLLPAACAGQGGDLLGRDQPDPRALAEARARCPDVEFRGRNPRGEHQWHCPLGQMNEATSAACPEHLRTQGIPCAEVVLALRECPEARYTGRRPDGRHGWHCPGGANLRREPTLVALPQQATVAAAPRPAPVARQPTAAKCERNCAPIRLTPDEFVCFLQAARSESLSPGCEPRRAALPGPTVDEGHPPAR